MVFNTSTEAFCGFALQIQTWPHHDLTVQELLPDFTDMLSGHRGLTGAARRIPRESEIEASSKHKVTYYDLPAKTSSQMMLIGSTTGRSQVLWAERSFIESFGAV